MKRPPVSCPPIGMRRSNRRGKLFDLQAEIEALDRAISDEESLADTFPKGAA